MDSAGIDAAVVLSHDGLFDPTPEANDDVAGFVAEYPDRMVAFGTVSPPPTQRGGRGRALLRSPGDGAA